MCTETNQFYACGCVTILYDVCADHIAHSRLQIDNNPCPKSKQNRTTGPRRCQGICEQRKDEFYNFETRGETLMERSKRVTEEWEAERKEREAQRLEREAVAAAYGKDDGGKENGIAHLSEGDNRAGKRVKREKSSVEMEVEDYEDEVGEFQMEDASLQEAGPDSRNAIRDLTGF